MAATATDDITTEALRRIAEKKREDAIATAATDAIATEALQRIAGKTREDAIAAKMREIAEAERASKYVIDTKMRELAEAEKKREDAIAAKMRELAEAERAREKAESDAREKIVNARRYEERILKRSAEIKSRKGTMNFCGFDAGHAQYLYRYADGTYGVRAEPLTFHGPFMELTPHLSLGGRLGKLVAPISWDSHFRDGLIPFMPKCPVCSKQTTMYARGAINQEYHQDISFVMCDDHYKWDGTTHKHYKWKVYSPRGAWVEWDPADPDGEFAAEAARRAQILDLDRQVATLQAKIAMLRAT